MRMHSCFAWLLAVLFCVVSGCGGPARPKTATVTGTVLLDGNPVEGAQVVFICEGAPRNATGKTDAAGKFSLTTFEEGDGAVLGEHKITVSKFDSSEAPAMSASDPSADYGAAMEAAGGGDATLGGMIKRELPEKYGDAKTSGLSETVADGSNDFTLELSSS